MKKTQPAQPAKDRFSRLVPGEKEKLSQLIGASPSPPSPWESPEHLPPPRSAKKQKPPSPDVVSSPEPYFSPPSPKDSPEFLFDGLSPPSTPPSPSESVDLNLPETPRISLEDKFKNVFGGTKTKKKPSSQNKRKGKSSIKQLSRYVLNTMNF